METTETNTVEIVVNGEKRRVPTGLTLPGLLAHLEIDLGRVAVELDRQIVRKAEWETTAIRGGAQLEIVWFVGGGRT